MLMSKLIKLSKPIESEIDKYVIYKVLVQTSDVLESQLHIQ